MIDIPTKASAGVTPGWHKLQVVDTASGEVIHGVREVDTEAGTLTRSEIDGGGNLVVKDGRFAVITETRATRLELRQEAAQTAPVSETPATEPLPGDGVAA